MRAATNSACEFHHLPHKVRVIMDQLHQFVKPLPAIHPHGQEKALVETHHEDMRRAASNQPGTVFQFLRKASRVRRVDGTGRRLTVPNS